MRTNLDLKGTAVNKLKGNVEHALKVVGGPDILQDLQLPSDKHPSFTVGSSCTVPRINRKRTVQGPPTPMVGTTNGGCWQYRSTNQLPVVMERPQVPVDPILGYAKPGCQCSCPASPAGPGLHSEGDRKGVIGEGRQPAAFEPDPRVRWGSGFMPVDPNYIRQFMPQGDEQPSSSWSRQLMPSWYSAHGRQPFNCGPRPNL